jgi:hypothetical protein
MEPGQYTGKSDATQGERPPADRVDGAAVPSPAPEAVPPPARPVARASGAPGGRRAANESHGSVMRAVLWVAVLAALVVGLVMYFQYERAVVPLIGGGR